MPRNRLMDDNGCEPVYYAGATRSPFVTLEGGAGTLMTVQQAADRLGLSTALVYGLCQSGRLPHVKLVNVIRIERARLDAFIAAHDD